jgi:hypothetical protein
MRFGRGKLGGSAQVRSSANSISLLSYSRLQSNEIRRHRASPALQLESCNTARRIVGDERVIKIKMGKKQANTSYEPERGGGGDRDCASSPKRRGAPGSAL